MNKYNIGQTLYWFKYAGHQPDLMSFEVCQIKQSKHGYRYGVETPNGAWIEEGICFDSIEAAVNHGCMVLKGFLVNKG
jgi:hypothetical protein